MGNCVGGSIEIAHEQHKPEPGPDESSKAMHKPDGKSGKGAASGSHSKPIEKENLLDLLPEDKIVGNYLKNVPLLSKLTDSERSSLGGALIEKRYAVGEAIITQDEVGHEFYIIREGKANVERIDPETKVVSSIAVLTEGDFFGEAALLNNEKRVATIRALTQTVCLALDADTFIKLFGKSKLNVQFAKRNAISAEKFAKEGANVSSTETDPKQFVKTAATVDLIANALRQNVLFASLDSIQLQEIVAEIYQVNVPAKTAVIKEGDRGDNFYIVESGEFDVFKEGEESTKVVAQRGPGSSFGELALMYNSPRTASVVSKTDAVLWAVSRPTFRRVLIRINSERISQVESFLKKVPLLSSLTSWERSEVAEALDEVCFDKGRVIVEQGSAGTTFFIILSGDVSVEITTDGTKNTVQTLSEGDFFGERALLTSEPRAATIIAKSDIVTCLVLEQQSFSTLLGPLTEIMERGIKKYSSVDMKEEMQSEAVEKIQPLMKITLEQLDIIGTLGKGSFGHVQLARLKTTGETFALKQISKYQIVQLGQQEHIMSEKNVMAALDHPFLIRLRATINTPDYLYLVIELCLGGELFSVLRSRIIFDEETAKFYTASVVCAFEYMHEKNIIYRDLKPENLLLDAQGFLKVTDFGFAKVVPDRTWTLCGTPDYLAPEVVSGQGHGKGVDWWTLGVLTYEMLASYPPFYDHDQMRTYANIIHGNISYPKHFSKESIDLIQKLLNSKPTKRLGVLKGGAKLIKKHPWFRGFDWNALANKTMRPPIIPTIKSNIDLTNFEEYQTEDVIYPPYEGDQTNWDASF